MWLPAVFYGRDWLGDFHTSEDGKIEFQQNDHFGLEIQDMQYIIVAFNYLKGYQEHNYTPPVKQIILNKQH